MNQFQKSLKKLSSKEKKLVERTVERLIKLDWSGLDIIKLKGSSDIYRARVRNLRIIFQYQNKKVDILMVGRRSEKIYRDF